jgi:phosphate-selective porin OprO/OprP
MKSRNDKISGLLVTAALSGLLAGPTLRAQDTNHAVLPAVTAPRASDSDMKEAILLIQQLQKRVEELEQKVKDLDSGRKAAEESAAAQSKQRIEELEQKLKNVETTQKTAEQAAAAQAKQRTEELDQKVKILERNRELDQEAAEARAKEAPKISIGDNGFSLASANGDFALQLKGVLQVDSRTFFHDNGIVGNDTLLIRRARPVLQGTVFRDFDFLFVPDFAPSTPTIFDAYLNYRYRPELQLQAGKMKSPIGLEVLVADVDVLFNERSLVTDLMPGRDIGFELHGDLFGGLASYTAGIFNGMGDTRNSSNADFEDNKAFEGRLFFQPFKKTSMPALQGFGFGVGGGYEDMQATNIAGLPSTTGGTLAGYTTDGQQQFFAYNPTNGAVVAAGQHWRLSPQANYYYGPFGLMAEYAISDQQVTKTGPKPPSTRLENTAWEVSGSWVLTGEDAAYKGGVAPRHPFNPREGNWGALQLVGRYARLDIDQAAFPTYANPKTSARRAAEWSVGLNWYLNRNIIFKTSYSHTFFQGGGGAGTSAPAAVTRQDENVLFTRLQLGF